MSALVFSLVFFVPFVVIVLILARVMNRRAVNRFPAEKRGRILGSCYRARMWQLVAFISAGAALCLCVWGFPDFSLLWVGVLGVVALVSELVVTRTTVRELRRLDIAPDFIRRYVRGQWINFICLVVFFGWLIREWCRLLTL